ncbi:hypothetical protein [Vibrio crassostreae]|uniref:hypothetical protein n=1 Tax=Vibrio crassostreae TaxID=246167 RepID=UPI00104E7D9F|nr:hypothetical protein [Vibrio crassostreae]CAK2112015.1 hypothetical protein VCRA2114O422_40056 [Vibrio crassostreae]CAK2116714.1 hypothetical protein VCRA2119O431_40056 [Vibrio crassostreae]CAK2122839.1 hypothetical protein VCRA2113O409_50058 [Vibrio crassostreae]CAK2123465.1 hypothetical protein VCRA2113O412_50056 [Vibrio crassostreae]CAK2124497.1 hypothetical protein VCRA2113O414_50056 [Vibrio crassostreae]
MSSITGADQILLAPFSELNVHLSRALSSYRDVGGVLRGCQLRSELYGSGRGASIVGSLP